MDYKYIEQLMERYWKCETTLEEEEILRTFFSQKDIPTALLPYADLFTYQHSEVKNDVLGDDFDQKMLQMIDEPSTAKARVITMTQRLKPLFKAAAVVAIFLTVGNAAQVSFNGGADKTMGPNVESLNKTHSGASVAFGDSAVMDSMQHNNPPTATILK
jgi:hypothetical protein